MYEFQNINQNILNDFYKEIFTIKKDSNKIFLLTKAIEYAVRKELPNEPKYIIAPIIKKVHDEISIIQKREFNEFKSEKEAKELFRKRYRRYLELSEKNKLSKEFEDLLYASYDLCKYDKKIIIDNKEYLFNTLSIFINYQIYKRAIKRWDLENKYKPDEMNINISHNTNKGLTNQLKFLKQSYNAYNNNPFTNDLQKDLEQHLISEYVKDRHIMARTIDTITNIKFEIDKCKLKDYETMINSYDSIKYHLNSDNPVSRHELYNSWLTTIAHIYLNINPKGIKYTTIGRYITTIAKATTPYKNFKDEYIIPLEKIKKKPIREFKSYYDLRLLEFTDERKKIPYSKQTVQETENYLKNIIFYLKKYSN